MYEISAERTSYFCLARKLIWLLGSTHIFTQRGWLMLFIPDHFSGQHQIGEGPPNTLFPRTDVITVRSPFSSSIMTPWGKPSNLWTSSVYSFRPRVPSWLWIRWIQSASHRNNFKSPSTLAMSTATQNSARSDIQPLHPWATFSGNIHTFLPKRPGPHIHERRQRSCPQPANTTCGGHISLTRSTMP